MKIEKLSKWPELTKWVNKIKDPNTPKAGITMAYSEIYQYLPPKRVLDDLNRIGKYILYSKCGTIHKDGSGWTPILKTWHPCSWPIIGIIKMINKLTNSNESYKIHPMFAERGWDVWLLQDSYKFESDIKQLLKEVENDFIRRFGDEEYKRCFVPN